MNTNQVYCASLTTDNGYFVIPIRSELKWAFLVGYVGNGALCCSQGKYVEISMLKRIP
jgi:hypothetical protein